MHRFLLCKRSLLAALPYFTSELLPLLQFYSPFCYQLRNDHSRFLPSVSFCVAFNPGRWEMDFHLNAVDQTVKELLLANFKMLHIFSSSLFFGWWWKRRLFKISFAYVSFGIFFFMAALKGTISCIPWVTHTVRPALSSSVRRCERRRMITFLTVTQMKWGLL